MSEADDYKKQHLLNYPINTLLFSLTVPALLGEIGMYLYFFIDMYFISFLGMQPIAAITFILPIFYVIFCIYTGFGIGVTVIVAHTLGAAKRAHVKTLITNIHLFCLICFALICIIGYLTVRPIFQYLGASVEILLLIESFTFYWYPANFLLSIPMIANSSMRARGDTVTVMINMLIASMTTLILNPCFIFGLGPFPQLGFKGSAVASLIGATLSCVYTFYFMVIRDRLITFKDFKVKDWLIASKLLLTTSIPVIFISILLPIGFTFITKIAATLGEETLVAFGIAYRIELFIVIIFTSLSETVIAIVGQNMTAKKNDRIKTSMKNSLIFCLLWGACFAIILAITSRYLAEIFTENLTVIQFVITYFAIVPLSYALQGMTTIITGFFIATKKTGIALSLSLFRYLFLMLPFAAFGAVYGGVLGFYLGISLANVLIGFVSLMLYSYQTKLVA